MNTDRDQRFQVTREEFDLALKMVSTKKAQKHGWTTD